MNMHSRDTDGLHAAISASGDVAYAWDVRTGLIRWHGDVRGLFGLEPGEALLAAEQFLARVAASGTADTGANAVDLSTSFEGQFQASVTFGTVAATNGLQIDAFRAVDAATGSTFDTIAAFTLIIPGTTSTSKVMSFVLQTGLWKLKVTNLDATNAVTNVKILYATLASIG